MVYYFTSNVVEPSGFIYVGKDKFESEWPSRYSALQSSRSRVNFQMRT
jgi:hypothetical protein